jgi:hypothetical protein
MRKFWGLTLALLLLAAPSVFAQSVGNIYGTVTDESGAVLPGVSVTLEGETGTRSTVTGPQGAFRFLNLNRGQYKVAASLTGFATVTRTIQVTTGENVEITIGMKVSGVQETVEVVGETPLVDTKKRGTATTMTNEELQQVPNARDPWGVLRNVPGVLLDRVNIAGNENGQQASAAGKGTDSTDKSWNLDGITVTDMSATGASPTYFDFDAFQEISVTTGGTDIAQAGNGIGINLVTKRGTNKFHGGGRFFYSGDDTSFGNVPDSLANDSRLQGNDKANHIEKITDYGFDLGGPILKDKLWFYFTWGKQDIKLVTLLQTPDDTVLSSYNAKLNWQAGSNTMVSAFWFLGNKQKFGRSAGFGLNADDSFNWNQDNAFEDKVGGPDRPPGLWKLSIDHTFSPNFFMSVKGAYYNTGFTLTPRGGLDQSFTLDYERGVATGSYIDYTAVRPQWHLNLDGNYFFEGLGGNNELKFGFAYRDMTTTSITHYGGNGLVGVINSPTDKLAWIARDGVVKYGGKYIAGYIGDTVSKDRMTLNVGVRWDKQTARNLESEAPANASFPNVVPALSYGGSEDLIKWNTISPRVGVSYALDEARKTVLRASYAYYADQLSFGDVVNENPSNFGYLAYGWNDINGDRVVQPGEVNLGDFQYNVNIDPANPGAVGSTVNKIDRDYKPRRDHEIVVGLDREIGANLAVGVAYTWKKGVDWPYRPRLAGQCSGEPTLGSCPIIGPSSYTANAPSSANGFTAFTYSPDSALVTAGGGGRLRTNKPDYSTTFNGIELTLVKRLSNKWMGRVAFSWNDWVENYSGTPVAFSGNPTPVETDPLVDGGQVALLSGGSGKASFYSSIKWQLYANGLYQLPMGFDVSGAIFGRQGGPYPISLRLSGGRDGTLSALATPEVDTDRYDTLWDLDLRLAKTFKFNQAALTLSAEWFNVMNSGTVLARYRYANSSNFTNTSQGAESGKGRIEEILSPSIFRFGARLTF